MANADEKALRVFVVHGRNESARGAMFSLLRSVGLRPIEWSQAVAATGEASPYIGSVLDAAFEEAQAVVVLMTPDEIAYLRSEYAANAADSECEPAAQARPNVLFEAGMALGRDPRRTVLVELGSIRPFSDIAGRHVIRMRDSASMRRELVQRLETAGCRVDLSGTDWLTAGDFSEPTPPGLSLPLGRRVPRSGVENRSRVDVRYHDRSRGGRLEILNRSTEPIRDVSIELPSEVQNFSVDDDELPIEELPAGKSIMLLAIRTIGRGKSHFNVRVTYSDMDGEAVEESVFLSLVS